MENGKIVKTRLVNQNKDREFLNKIWMNKGQSAESLECDHAKIKMGIKTK
jgi:hypothetical protein